VPRAPGAQPEIANQAKEPVAHAPTKRPARKSQPPQSESRCERSGAHPASRSPDHKRPSASAAPALGMYGNARFWADAATGRAVVVGMEEPEIDPAGGKTLGE